MTYRVIKRLLDIILSIFALTILSPVILLISIIIKSSTGGPIYYRGFRAGKDSNNFYIVKFRSMVVDAENKGGYSTALDDPRFTRVGLVLRKYKLDELPQFFNVLRGDMSLVGPRPQVLYYTKKYSNEEKLILSVKPGITDIASLYFSDMDGTLGIGNVDSKYERKIEPIKKQLQMRYVRECSFMLDIRILVETTFKLIGINKTTGLDLSP